MSRQFEIVQSSLSFTDRPPISHKVREYFEVFIMEEILTPKKILITTNWQIHLVLTFSPEAPRYKADSIFMPKTSTTVKSERTKIYDVLIPKKIIDQSDQPYLRTIELMWEAITLFFTRTYKKVTQAEMDALWQKADLDYLLSLPYPAPIAEQKYLADVVTSDGRVVDRLGRQEW